MSDDGLDADSGERPERIAKMLARAGVCSRRDAERWIIEGRVSVDGQVLTTPAVTVTAANDIRVDGTPLPAPERPRLWRYHKPAGLITTTVFQKLALAEMERDTLECANPAVLERLADVADADLGAAHRGVTAQPAFATG